MKRLFVLALAAVLVAALAMPAAALENKFGGYFDTEFVSYKALRYQDDTTTAGNDYSTIRSRTRLYYTAVLSENLSFINKFEFDTEWGQQSTGYGDLGADGIAIEVKNTYVDFKLAQLRWEIGTQGFELHRGLLIADDASGLKLSYRGLDNVIPAFWWFRLMNGDKSSTSPAGDNGQDADQYTLLANVKLGNLQIVPEVSYLHANNAGSYFATHYDGGAANTGSLGVARQAVDIYFVGLDLNFKSDMFGGQFSGIYEGGSLSDTLDISAYALNLKGDVKLGKFGVNAEILYTTGEKVDAAGNRSGDYGGFWYPQQCSWGANYTTAKFFRKDGATWTKYPISPSTGVYDNTPAGNSVENRFEFGVGADFAVTKSVKLALDWWNLNYTEDVNNGNSDIGNEFDFNVNWKIMKNLQFDLFANYLIYGDAVKKSVAANNEADYGYELSGLLRLNF